MVKNPPAKLGDLRDVGSISGSGRSPGGEYGYSIQYSCLENPTDRGTWQATVQVINFPAWLKWLSMQSKIKFWIQCETGVIPPPYGFSIAQHNFFSKMDLPNCFFLAWHFNHVPSRHVCLGIYSWLFILLFWLVFLFLNNPSLLEFLQLKQMQR